MTRMPGNYYPQLGFRLRDTWVVSLALPLSNYITLDKWPLFFSVLVFLLCKMGSNNFQLHQRVCASCSGVSSVNRGQGSVQMNAFLR